MHRTLFGELNQTFQQLFLLERIAQTNTAEQLRGEVRDTRKLHHFALGERIADLDGAVVMQTNDVARIRLFNMRTVTGHEGQRVGDNHVFADTHLAQLHAFFVLA
ncbi:hypothetical protein D3C80_1915700 [compost metagenome]